MNDGFLARTISWEDYKYNNREDDVEEGMYGSLYYQTFKEDNDGDIFGVEEFYYNLEDKQEADKKGIMCEASDFIPFNIHWYSTEVERLKDIIEASLEHSLVDIGKYDNPIYYFEYKESYIE